MSLLARAALRAQEFLMVRRTQYIRVFDFENSNAQAVLQDLAKFCRASESTFHPDPRIEGRLDGRREVWLRIQHHLQLTPDQLWKLYSGSQPPAGE